MAYRPCWILDIYDERDCKALLGCDIAYYQSKKAEELPLFQISNSFELKSERQPKLKRKLKP
jgi:hypothetical protein